MGELRAPEVDGAYEHVDAFSVLSQDLPLTTKLGHVQQHLKDSSYPVDRVAIAVYDPSTDELKALAASGTEAVLRHYQAKLEDCPSLCSMVARDRPRVIDDLRAVADGGNRHTVDIRRHYRSSYTLPLRQNGDLYGFVFFNSYERAGFRPEFLPSLDLVGHAISSVILHEVSAVKTLLAAVRTAREMANQRDAETGSHLQRMAHYSQLIARQMAATHSFDEEYIERVFLFAPLHDIGKLAVPDRVLLKPGRLTDDELRIMRSHVASGVELVDTMLAQFGLGSFRHAKVLRNIVGCHHEKMDGTGYPAALPGDAIPLEARIVAVADIFDALTSRRPYKPAWSTAEAIAALVGDSGLDQECVDALIQVQDQVELIRARFPDQGPEA